MAKDEPVDHRLRQGMCHMPTEQDPDPQEKDPTFQNNNNTGVTLQQVYSLLLVFSALLIL